MHLEEWALKGRADLFILRTFAMPVKCLKPERGTA
jgi:hypothetical protein